MIDTDTIIIFVIVLFIFYIPLCWFSESYNNQKGGYTEGENIIDNATKHTNQAITATMIAPLDLLAQGVNRVIGVFSEIPDKSISIGKDTLDNALAPFELIFDELELMYANLNQMQSSLLENDIATNANNTHLITALNNIKIVMDTIVDDITTIVNTYNVKLKEFAETLPGLIELNDANISNLFDSLGLDKNNFVLPPTPFSSQIASNEGRINVLEGLKTAIETLTETYKPLIGVLTGFNEILKTNTTAVNSAKTAAESAKIAVDTVDGIMRGIDTDLGKIFSLTNSLTGDATALKTTFNQAIEAMKTNLTTTKTNLSNVSTISFQVPGGIPGISGTKTVSVTPPSVGFIDQTISSLNSLKF
jgi:hypothetical protein